MDRHAPESPGEELRFHSAAAAYAALWRGLVFGLGALIVAATVVGQIRAHRFPAWSDLAISAALPFVAYDFLAALTALGCRLLPVRVSADGIRTANYWGVPTFVPWSPI